MGIIFGLIAALCFGFADFVVTQATRKIGVLQALLAIQFIGVLAVSGVLIWMQQVPPFSLEAWIFMGGISLINFMGTMLLYRAFAIGTLSLVSPIASGFAVVTALLALSMGERPPVLTIGGTIFLITGVIVVARTPGHTGAFSLRGIPEAVGAAICFGIYFWAIDRITPALGVFWPVWMTRLVQLLCAFVLLGIRRSPVQLRNWKVVSLLVIATLLDSTALLSFNLGIEQTYTTISTALASLYSVVTVLLAWLFLQERLSRGQWIGIGVVLTGVVLVSI